MKKQTQQRRGRRPYLIIQEPLDAWGLLFFIVALAGVMIIRNNYVTSNLKFASDTLYLGIGAGAAFVAILMVKIFYQIRSKDRVKDPRMIRFTYNVEGIKDGGIFDAGDVRLDVVLCIVSYFAIQIIIWVIGEEAFQVSQVDKFFFYIFAALIEEVIYRGAIVMILQALLARVFHIQNGSQIWIVNLIVMVISGIAFMFSHTSYYGDPIKMTITFLGGVSQAFWYIRSKILIVPMAGHAAVNFVYAGSILQGASK